MKFLCGSAHYIRSRQTQCSRREGCWWEKDYGFITSNKTWHVTSRECHFKCSGPVLGGCVSGFKAGEHVDLSAFVTDLSEEPFTADIDTLIDYLNSVMDDIITGQKNVVVKELKSENPQMQNKTNCLCAFWESIWTARRLNTWRS